MSHRENASQTECVALSPLEGRRLVTLLSERIERGDPRDDLAGLESLRDMISDAGAVALWLRENVNIEPCARQTALLREVLANAPSTAPSTASSASQPDAVVSGIQAKLANYTVPEPCPAKTI